MERILIRVEEAANLATISRARAYELVASGEWPSLTIGRSRRIPLADLQAWIDARVHQQSQTGTHTGQESNDDR